MDVRCERCQTEYELEDDTVSEGGTQVQCTTCGHTFLVGARRDDAVRVDEEPPLADWLLETSDGQVHRFRNLTSLQKWIIERKVTRNDKISRTGHAWRRLGEIVELGPFFDVVDEADRAKATSARSLVVEAEAARRAATRPSPAAPMPAQGGVTGRRATPSGGMRGQSASSEILPLEGQAEEQTNDFAAAEFQTAVVRTDGAPWIKLLVGLGMAGAVAWVGITQPWKPKEALPTLLASPTPTTSPTSVGLPAGQSPPGAAPPIVAPPTSAQTPTPIPSAPGALPLEAALAAAGKAAGASGTSAPPAPPPGKGATPPTAGVAAAGAAPAGAGATPPTAGAAAAGAAPDPGAKGEGKAKAGGKQSDEGTSGGTRSYEKLVGEADRLLENGSTARAMKLYDQALALRSNGPEAITGLGYVNLDRGRGDIAIGYFKRALSASYAPAAFALGEAHRQGGDTEQAVAHYEKYLQLAPSGSDAAAARRQLRALQAKQAGGQASVQAPTPPPPTVPGAAPVSPASVLDEPAKP